MKIEILTPNKMVQKGSALYRLLMNDHTPVLDLFVRESIQNSLDAAACKDNLSVPVNVHYRIDSFDKTKLNGSLEGIEDKLNKRFVGLESKYISITDTGTQGLTGPMSLNEVKGDDSGNLINLVYDICKPQGDEGAGGSWGIGKTVYFRIGIGLVIYYSRIFNEHTNTYESRLAASLVEDEKSSNAIIPQYKNYTKYGIAWWGNKIAESDTIPITDEDYIKDFLSIFRLSEFSGTQTGTVIIIPYINEQELLKHNAIIWEGQTDDFVPYWRNSIENYLKVAVQRWYFPRLDNKDIKHAKQLKVKINNTSIDYSSFLPIFKLEQALYNRALNQGSGSDYLSGSDVKVETIRLRSVLENSTAGHVSFVKVNKKNIGMCPPYNDYHPNINFNIPITDPAKNEPVVAFCRKPGMIVAYDQNTWVKNVPACSSDEFILAVFVLNSTNKLSSANMTLEAYIRKGEHADHSSWNDSSIEGVNPYIVQKIQNNVSRNLCDAFTEADDKVLRKNSGLGKFLGDMILPPIGFGSLPTHKPTGGSGGTTSKNSVRYKFDNVEYNGDVISITYKVLAKSPAQEFGFETLISSESTSISFDAWEQELGLTLPFKIISQYLKISKLDGDKWYGAYTIRGNDEESDDLLTIRSQVTSKESCYGMKVTYKEKHIFEAQVIIKFLLHKKDIRPIIKPL